MSQPIDVGIATISCPYGVIGKILDFGFNDFGSTGRASVCANSDLTLPCKPNNAETLEELKSFKGQTHASWTY
jgi:hypothetical protein